MLKFAVYQGGEASTLENLGTVKENAGVGGGYKLASEKNVRDLNKKVSIIIRKADGTSVPVNCSNRVSEALRSKKLTMAQLGDLSILYGPFTTKDGEEVEGAHISFTGSTMTEIAVTDLKKAPEAAVLSASSIEDLIAF